jgi:hypothetical protein
MPLSQELFNRHEANKGRNGAVGGMGLSALSVSSAVEACGPPTPTSSTSTSSSSSSASSSSSSSSPPEKVENKQNVRDWHWTERNISKWALARMTTLLTETTIAFDGGALTIVKVSNVEGEADICTRKGKRRLGFDLKATLKWKGEINDADGATVVECGGTAAVDDFDDTMDEDEYCVSKICIDDDDVEAGSSGGKVLLQAMRSAGRAAVIKQLILLVAEMQAKKHES